MPLSSDTKKVFGMCLAVHFGFTEEVKEDEKGREEGEGEEEEEKEVDESVDPTPYHSTVTTPESWYYDPDPDGSMYGYVEVHPLAGQSRDAKPNKFDPMDYPGSKEEFFAALNYKCAVADAERSVCRLRFLLLQKGSC